MRKSFALEDGRDDKWISTHLVDAPMAILALGGEFLIFDASGEYLGWQDSLSNAIVRATALATH